MSNEEKKNILGEEVDEKELASVSGGTSHGRGGCSSNYYNRKCDATVEKGSWCRTHDWCVLWSEKYEEAPDCHSSNDESMVCITSAQ